MAQVYAGTNAAAMELRKLFKKYALANDDWALKNLISRLAREKTEGMELDQLETWFWDNKRNGQDRVTLYVVDITQGLADDGAYENDDDTGKVFAVMKRNDEGCLLVATLMTENARIENITRERWYRQRTRKGRNNMNSNPEPEPEPDELKSAEPKYLVTATNDEDEVVARRVDGDGTKSDIQRTVFGMLASGIEPDTIQVWCLTRFTVRVAVE